jgi:hypothetical protein
MVTLSIVAMPLANLREWAEGDVLILRKVVKSQIFSTILVQHISV